MITRRMGVLLVVAWLAVGCASAAARAPAAPPAAAPPAGAASAPGGMGESASARPAAPPLDPPQLVRVSYTQSAGEVPLYIGVEHGYFTELGLEVELVRTPGSADSIVLITAGQLEVAGLLITPAFYNAVARDVGVRMVADRGSNVGSQSSFHLAVRADLLQHQPWTGYQNLRGLKVALPQRGSMAEYYLERMLQRGGLQLSDVEIVAPLTFPDMAAAFANRGIDAALYLEPWATQQEEEGVIKRVVSVSDVAPGSHTAALVYGDVFARNTQAARNFMVGWLRSVRHVTDVYAGYRDFQDILTALKKYTALKDDELIRKMPPTRMNPEGYLDPEKLAEYQDWFASRGLVPQKADIAKVYDPSFAEYANAVLGPYRPDARPSGG
ncbi:MAG TPA: ABC transporter substrate-binding protein [Chloroflexota bacterium]|nr:ABC transporter substrate-binding protein [Chloroflexota bacterium]